MSYGDMHDRLTDVARDVSVIVDLCKFKGDTDSPVYRRAKDALEKLESFLEALESD